MAAVPVALMVIGTAVSAYGAVQSAQARRDMASHNRDVENRNALIAKQQGDAQAQQLKRDQIKRMGAARANAGASGVAMEGSALDVLEESAFNAEMDQMTLKYNTQLRAMGHTDNASMYGAMSANAMPAGYTQAGSTLLIGAANAYSAGAT